MVNTAHAALPHLESTAGALVAVGSVAGRVPTPWLAVYAAAKHGVRGFVRSLDAELRGLVVAEITRALVRPRTERSVGGLMAAWAPLDAVAPNLPLRLMGSVAKLRLARPGSASGQPARRACGTGGRQSRQRWVRGRPSLLVKFRDLARIGR